MNCDFNSVLELINAGAFLISALGLVVALIIYVWKQ